MPPSPAVLQATPFRNVWQNDLNHQVKNLKRDNMTYSRELFKSIALAAGLLCTAAFAQTSPAPYGSPITFEQAKKAMVAAEAEARKNNWQVVISIVDSGGHLVMLQRLDAQTASVEIATGKATSSAALRRPTKALEDGLAAGGAGLRILSVRSVTALQGGVPILLDGKIIGAIGVSGVMAAQDEVVAMAGAAAVAAK
jgi:glc operon protein GlcG